MLTANTGGPLQSFEYDAVGFRTKKTVADTPSESTVYLSSGTQVIAEYDGEGVTEYLYFGGRPLATYDSSTTTLTYLHYDHLSLRLETDADGGLVSENWHYPFGEQGGGTYGGSNNFTAYERDDAEFDYAKFRYLAPQYGRFRSPDPIHGTSSNPQSWNRYAYVAMIPSTTSIRSDSEREHFTGRRFPTMVVTGGAMRRSSSGSSILDRAVAGGLITPRCRPLVKLRRGTQGAVAQLVHRGLLNR